MGSTYNPAAQSTTFKWTVGTFDMVLYGKMPNSASNVAQTVNVVSLYGGAGGSALDQITVQATSAGLANFNVLYAQQETKLKGLISSGVAQGYIDIFTNVLNASRTIANAGDVNDATALLNSLNASNAPVTLPHGNAFHTSYGCSGGCSSHFCGSVPASTWKSQLLPTCS